MPGLGPVNDCEEKFGDVRFDLDIDPSRDPI